jgi:hypothetical protein
MPSSAEAMTRAAGETGVLAVSIPGRAISARSGDTRPPWGVPAVVGEHTSSSMIPDRRHARTCRRRPGGAGSLAKSA